MAQSSDRPFAPSPTKVLVGATEGVVNLVYVFVAYLLLAGPVLAVGRSVFPAGFAQALAVGITALVLVVILVILVGIGRLSGPLIAVAFGVVALGVFALVPPGDLGLPPGAGNVWSLQLVVGLTGLIVLLAARGPVRRLGGRVAKSILFPLVVSARPNASAAELTSARRHTIQVLETSVDLLLLLVAGLVVRPSLFEALGSTIGPVPGAIVVSGALVLVWIILSARMWTLGRWPGLLLAFLLGTPLFLSLPLLDRQLVGIEWPAPLVGWIVATLAALLLVAARRPLQTVGQSTFGPALDRGLMGVQPANGEVAGEQRARALGGVVGALVDVGLLLAAYWLIGIPIVTALERSTGSGWLESASVVALMIAVVAVVWSRLRTAQRTIGETSNGAAARRAVVLLGLLLSLATVLVGCLAAVPAVLAAPTVERFGLSVPVDHVVVNWQFWQPATPSETEATYNVAISCSNGSAIGEFREVFRPPAPAGMPSGALGSSSLGIGPGSAACSSWRDTYFRVRRAAGLTSASSLSWNWVDAQFALSADGSADVVERHWVTFTSGVYDQIEWTVSGDLQGRIDRITLQDGNVPIPVDPTGSLPHSYVETHLAAGISSIVWHFPAVSAPAERSFIVQYHLPRAFAVTGGRAKFSRVILRPRAGPVWRTTVAVTFPNGSDLSTLQLTSSDAIGTHAALDHQTAWFESKDQPSSGSLTIGADYPSAAPSAFAPAATTTNPDPPRARRQPNVEHE